MLSADDYVVVEELRKLFAVVLQNVFPFMTNQSAGSVQGGGGDETEQSDQYFVRKGVHLE